MSPEAQLKHDLEDQAEEILSAAHKEELAKCRGEVEVSIKDQIDAHAKDEAAKYAQIHEQLVEVQKQLAAIQKLFEQGRTTLLVLKWIGYGAGGLWVAIVWAKDHIKL